MYSADFEFEDIKSVFEEYRLYLEGKLRKNMTTEDICQLSAVYDELSMPIQMSIDNIENYINSCNSDNSGLYRAYINLSFYYYDFGNIEKVVDCAQKASDICPNRAEAYYILGLCYFDNDEIEKASVCFNKASSLCDNSKYKYNSAVAYIEKEDYTKAYEILSTVMPDDKVLYAKAICCCCFGENKKALELIEKIDVGNEIDNGQLADIYYLCGEYEKHNKMYDECNYYFSADWLAPYFYCLKVQNKLDESELFYNKVIDSKNADIEAVANEELDDEYTAEERNSDVQKLLDEKNEIVSAYIKIVNDDYKPEVKPKPLLKYGCFLLDCPLHQKID